MIATIPGLVFLALVVTLPIGFAFAACAIYAGRHGGGKALALLTDAVILAVIMVAAIVRDGVVVMGAGAALLGFLASAAVVNARAHSGESHGRPSVSH